jgi:CubicO group peptidase (beta-lactamase class C family)
LNRYLRFVPLALGLSFVSNALSQSATSHVERMRQLVQNYVDNKSFMGTVLVAKQDKILLSEGYGYADLEWTIANSPATKFRIGSITKQFTAASVLLLQENGKLNLEEPVKTYLPDAPKAWDKVTVYDLLTHTSGIPNFTGLPGWDAYKLQDHTPQDDIALFREKPLDFEPGAKFYYSNSNYILLGQIIETVSGMSYADFLQKNIFAPLGMMETGVDSTSLILPQRAQGYDSVPDGFKHAAYLSTTIPYSAGFLYSTVGDLLKWERGLFGGRMLSAASLRTMTTANKGGYGMGLFIKDAAHHGVITHNGSIEGFDTSLNFYPEKQITIVVLGNVKTDAPDKIAEQLGKVTYDEKVVVNSDRKLVHVAPSVLADYAGHYSAHPFAIAISVEDDRLIATTPGGRRYILYSDSQTEFFLKEIDVQIEYVRDPTTKQVTQFIMTQDGVQKKVSRD